MNLKHFFRDACVFLLSIFGTAFLYQTSLQKKGPLVRIVVFHDVADLEWFQSVLAMFARTCALITPAQFAAEQFDESKINVLLTFDDGYQSWVDICAPALKEHDCKALFFVNSGLLNIAGDVDKVRYYMTNQLLISPKAALSWEGARKLLQDGHTIGGHSVMHRDLAALSAEELRREIVEDKETIERNLDIVLADFAYPFGRKNNWNGSVAQATTDAGYLRIYTAETGFVKMHASHEINRVCLEKRQSLTSILQWIKGGYDIFSRLTHIK